MSVNNYLHLTAADGTVGVLVSSRRKKKRLGPAGEVVTPEQPLNRAINIQDRISMCES